MKYTIISVFFATIVAVSAILSGNFEANRLKQPSRWIRAVRNCLTDIPNEIYNSYVSYNITIATRAAKCIALCYYIETGEFADGKFDEIAIENFRRDYIGHHQSLEKLINVYKAAAAAGNAEMGGPEDKAYAYHVVIGRPENIKILQTIFRPIRSL